MQAFLIAAMATLSVAVSASAVDKPEFYFSWTVTEHDGAKLQIIKTADGTTVAISTANDSSASMNKEDAMALGKVLEKAKTTKVDEGASQEFKAGKMVVIYRGGDKGFSASVRKDGSDNGGVALSRQQATALAPFLMKADKMVARVDHKIKPNDWRNSQKAAPFIYSLF